MIKASSLIKFDPFWTDLIQSDQNKMTIFIIKGKQIDKKDYEFVKCGKSGKFRVDYEKSMLRAFARSRAKN